MQQTAIRTRAPGPRGHMLLGCLGEFRRDTIGLLERSARQHGDVVRIRIGPVTTHLVNHPAHVEHVLVSHAENYDKKTRSVAKVRATCGDSLLALDGPAWQRHRRLIQPAFRCQHLQRFLPLIAEQTRAVLQRWRGIARSGQEIDVVSEMMQLTLTIAAKVLFGADVEGKADVIERSLGIVMQDTWRRLQSALDLSVISPRCHRPQFRRAVEEIDAVVYQILDDRREQECETDDLLSTLLAAHQAGHEQQLSDRELRDAVITLLLAGHETTAHALAWTFYLVSQTPDVEERLHDAARRTSPEAATETSTYAGMVFQEAIRLYPSVWILERRAIRHDVIGGFHVPAGSSVLVSPYLLHRHPDFWDAPDNFDPQRFAAERRPAIARHSYIPFGLGAHQCIGQHMAILVADQILSAVYGEFRLRLVPGQDVVPQPGITLQHADGLRMTLENDS